MIQNGRQTTKLWNTRWSWHINRNVSHFNWIIVGSMTQLVVCGRHFELISLKKKNWMKTLMSVWTFFLKGKKKKKKRKFASADWKNFNSFQLLKPADFSRELLLFPATYWLVSRCAEPGLDLFVLLLLSGQLIGFLGPPLHRNIFLLPVEEPRKVWRLTSTWQVECADIFVEGKNGEIFGCQKILRNGNICYPCQLVFSKQTCATIWSSIV